MAANSPSGPPQLGATFVPGGFDDYYMPAPAPELVSPAPQRITPEVPDNIQNNLATLELNDKPSAHSPPSFVQSPPPLQPHSAQSYQNNRSSYSSYQYLSDQPPKVDLPNFGATDMPNFSPFPAVTAKPNVPPSDEEKEQILENARLPVLNSNDPEMQLAWAQDVLAYVATSQLFEERIAINKPKRATTPEMEHQLRVDAMNIVNFLAEQHHPKAEFMKGMWLEFGNFGLRQDKREAFRCYMRAADQGYARAQYRMGMQFEQGNDPMKALLHYRKGAEAGDSASNYRLGMMTLMGQMGQQQDYARGIAMLRVAAEHADENAPQGAYVLGMLQIRELPQVQIPEVLLAYDEDAGRLNIEKAAYLGFAKAQLKMGAAYELCSMGCEFDPALSLHYNSLAARQGEAEAEMAISKWFLCGYEGIFQKNEELAYVYAERAAQSGLPTAEFAMGYFNEIGMHVSVNIGQAKEWYEKAAKNGNADATQRLEGLKQDQTLSKKDHEQVAINRIRSQYGSKRGGRPDRFKAKVPDLPSVSDNGDENDYRLPPRSASVAPYPLSEQPPDIRPGSTAPYPLNSGPPHTNSAPAGGFFAGNGPSQNQRHSAGNSTAFGVNPGYNQPPRPSTTVNDGRGRQGYSNSPRPGEWDQRPRPNQGPLPDRQAGYNQQQRPADMGYQGPGGRNGSKSPRPQQPMQDIGFVAPPNPHKPHSQSPVHGHGGRPSPGPQDYNRPPRDNSRPGTQQSGGYGGQQQGFGGSQQGGRPQQQQRPQGTPPIRPGQQQQQQKPQKPKPQPQGGNGPKTFAEMGIPAQKKEDDCIVM